MITFIQTREGEVLSKLNKLTKKAQEHMEPGETVIASVIGAYSTKVLGSNTVRNGVLIATDQRVLFYAKKFGGFELESFPYPNISSFEMSKGFSGHKIKMFASGNEVEVKWINHGDLDLLMKEVRSRLKSSNSAPVPALDPTDELRKYAALRDEGVINDEEFEAKKKQLLGL